MNILKLKNLDDIPSLENSICAFGTFDSFHIGHKELLKICLKEKKLKKACLVFDFPYKLYKTKNIELLASLEDKINFLQGLNFDYVFVIELNEDIIKIKAEEFVNKLIIKANIKKVVCGEDFSFGFNKEGNVKFLQSYKDFETIVCPIFYYKGEKISSTIIREMVKEGKIRELNINYLGYYYSLKGEVVHGLANGRLLGFPTANLKLNFNYIVPKNGVYATLTKFENKTYLSMTNIGSHPTIDKLEESSIETNIFDFEENLYGKTIQVYFLDKIRDEKKFSSLDELVKQLKEDEQHIRQAYGEKVYE